MNKNDAIHIAKGIFSMYCDNIDRDSDWWHGIENFDINLCCDDSGLCEAYLYPVINGKTDYTNFERVATFQLPDYEERETL
jgi:hypothetical protein